MAINLRIIENRVWSPLDIRKKITNFLSQKCNRTLQVGLFFIFTLWDSQMTWITDNATGFEVGEWSISLAQHGSLWFACYCSWSSSSCQTISWWLDSLVMTWHNLLLWHDVTCQDVTWRPDVVCQNIVKISDSLSPYPNLTCPLFNHEDTLHFWCMTYKGRPHVLHPGSKFLL